MAYTLSDFGVSFARAQMKNGVDVFFFHRVGMPVCIKVKYLAGSRFEEIPGTAHFLEHILVSGTSKFPTKDKLAERIEHEGGSFFASTGVHSMDINIDIPKKEDVEIGLEILGEMIFDSLFADKTIENERGAILAEIGENRNSPTYLLGMTFANMAYRGTPMERDVAGDHQSVSSIKKENLLNFRESRMNSSNMSIFVSGGVNMEECLPLLNKHLARHPYGDHFAPPTKLTFHREKNTTFVPFGENCHVYMDATFFTMPIMENKREEAALNILKNILGTGRASRLAKELRYKTGLVYGYNASYNPGLITGEFSITTSFEKSKLNNVVDVLLAEVRKIKEEGVSLNEVEFVKSAQTKSTFNTTQTSRSWINLHHNDFFYYPNIAKTYDQILNTTETITKEEVNKVAKKYFTSDNIYIAFSGISEIPQIDLNI